MQNHHSIDLTLSSVKIYIDSYEKNENKQRTKFEHLWAIGCAILITATSFTIFSHSYWMLPFNIFNALIVGLGINRFNKNSKRSKSCIGELYDVMQWLKTQKVTNEDEAEVVLSRFDKKFRKIVEKYVSIPKRVH